MSNPETVIEFLRNFSYLGIFFSIASSGYLVPVPEEIVLLAIGYLSAIGYFSIYLAIIVSFFATFTSDILLYSLAKRDSKYTKTLKTKMQTNKIVKAWISRPNEIGKIVFIMRFFVGLRFLGPILAGAMNMSFKKFILYDSLALIIYTPFFVLLGYQFNKSFFAWVTRIKSIQHFLFFIALAGITLFVLYLSNKNVWRMGDNTKNIAEEEAKP